jgi:thioredoxin 1
MNQPNIVAITDAGFDSQVLQASGAVLLKFEAEWCGPCKAMKPMIEEIAAEYGERLTIATLDIDQNNQTPYKLGVRGVPTVMLFKDGKVVAQKVGLPRKADLIALIDSNIGSQAA